MARGKQLLGKLPANPLTIMKAMGTTEERSAADFTLSLFVERTLDPALLTYAKEAFRPQTDKLSISVIPFFDEPAPLEIPSDLVIIMAAKAPLVSDLMLLALKERIPAVVVTLDPLAVQKTSIDNHFEIDLKSMVTVQQHNTKVDYHKQLFKELGAWISREFKDDILPLARALPFVRDPFVKSIIQTTSLQNATISSLFFLPGSDMPLLTLNQVKLFLQIAAVYQADLDKKRFKELSVLLLSAYGFRMLSRRLVAMIPVISWAIKGAIGYSGTLAVGVAAQEYFERESDLKSFLPIKKKTRQDDGVAF